MIIRIDVCLTIFGLLFGLFSITLTVDVPQTTSQQQKLATNSIRRTTPTLKDTVTIPVGFTPSVSNIKQVAYPNDINPLNQYAKTKQNINNPHAAAGKPQATVTSVSNSDDRSILANTRKNVNLKTTSKTISTNTGSDNVVFPTSHKNITGHHEILTRTGFPTIQLTPSDNDIKNCERRTTGGTLCNITENYPTQIVRTLLNSRNATAQFAHLFGVDTISKNPFDNIDIHTRFDDDGGYKSFCPSEEKVMFPKLGRTPDNEWKYILQDPSGSEAYSQGVRVETCLQNSHNKTLPCNLVELIPNGYTTHCSQKYIIRKLLTVSKDAQMSLDSILMPSCCVCVYRDNLDARSDFSTGVSNTQPMTKKPSSPRSG